MSDSCQPVPPDRRLGAADMRRLFDQLSSHLRAGGSTGSLDAAPFIPETPTVSRS